MLQNQEFEDYLSQKQKWPASGQQIQASYDSESLILYQAYSSTIAKPAIEFQDFVTNNPNYNPKRMTWVKPNFLWMMFRSGWGTKHNQENILAFKVRKNWFEACVLEAGLSGKDKNCKNKSVVVQWDPDHSPSGAKNSLKKAIQIGLRKNRAEEWALGNKGPGIIEIFDFTEFVRQADHDRINTQNFLMPKERIYPFEAKNIDLTNSLWNNHNLS